MALVGSMKEQFSKIEKGLEVSRRGVGIFSRISSKRSCGKYSSLGLGFRFWQEGGNSRNVDWMNWS